MSDNEKRILIVDDHALFADGLSLILASLGSHISISVSNSAEEVLRDMSALAKYDLVLIDLHMPRMDGFSFLSAIRVQKSPIWVGVISGTEHQREIERSIGLGARGFIPKDSSSDDMLAAISTLLRGQRYLPEQWAGTINFLDHSEPTPSNRNLTERQLQVLGLMRDGLQNKQIAVVMGISVSAVKGHIENVFKIMGVNNRTACVQVASERGLL